MANAPMFLGGDLTALDNTGKQLLTNDEVIAVDQSGHPAQQIAGRFNPVWVANLGDGTYYVALFNLNAFPSPMQVEWSAFGFARASSVRDLWNHIDLGPSNGGFNTVVLGHGVRLLKVVGSGHAAPPRSQSYEAEAGTLSGGAAIAARTPCSGGLKVGDLGIGANNTVTINNVSVGRDGYYNMQIDSMTIGPRALSYQVNGGPFQTLNAGGGSFFIPASSTVPVKLNAGRTAFCSAIPPAIHRILTG